MRQTTSRPRRPTHVPGEPELWMLILGDLVIFAVFFGVWAWNDFTHPDLFAEGRQGLDATIGFINTLVLVTSSMVVARGLTHVRVGQPIRAQHCYRVAALLGVTFAVFKVIEYRSYLEQGATPATNDFYMLYFVFTGIHLLHVVVGVAGLTALARRCRRPQASLPLFEGIGVYWHMVDLLWIVLFYLIYLS